MHSLQVVTDCEGPLVLNDNAFELCQEFLGPEGGRFFRQVSRYEEILAEVVKRPGFRTGATLKLILPFLKAAGLTNARLQEFCRRTVKFMPGARGAYRFLIHHGVPVFIESTSYRPFALAVAQEIKLAADRVFATDLNLDHYHLSEAEKNELDRLKTKFCEAPELELDLDNAAADALPQTAQDTIGQFDRIFTEVIPALAIGRLYQEVDTLGGPEKAAALQESLKKTRLGMENVIYVGDGITDVEAFEAVAAGGGVGISFNGNHFAVATAQVIVVSDSAWSVGLLASIFRRWGKEGIYELITMTQAAQQKILAIPEGEIAPLMTGLEGKIFNIYQADTPKLAQVKQDSAAMRSRLRGAAIASLG